jgi:hypothetical protein
MKAGESLEDNAEPLLRALKQLRLRYQERNFPAVVKQARALLTKYPGVTPLLLLKALAIAQLDDAAADLAPWGRRRECANTCHRGRSTLAVGSE